VNARSALAVDERAVIIDERKLAIEREAPTARETGALDFGSVE
jgi:hypothetical protein